MRTQSFGDGMNILRNCRNWIYGKLKMLSGNAESVKVM